MAKTFFSLPVLCPMDSCRWVIKQESEFPLNDLRDSVLIEILILLPLPSMVLHCKWVSKRWFSLISNPYFVRHFITQHQQQEQHFMLLNHFFHCPSHKRLHIANSSNKPEFKSIAAYLQNQDRDRSRNYHTNWLRASCNDLLLCFHKAKDRVVIYSVMNPITRQCLKLPPVPRRLLLNQVGIICTYDYNNSSSSFRVVLIPKFSTKLKVFKVHIFSSNTSKWSESLVLVSDQEGFELYKCSFQAVPYKGLLFWCGKGGRLLGFDPYNNNSRCCHSYVIEGPADLATNIDCFGVSQGCLRISQIAFPGSCLKIWELKDYDIDNNGGQSKWCLEHNVYINQMVSEKWLIKYVNRNYDVVSVLAFHPNDGDIMYLLIQSKVVLCNLQSRTMDVFCDIPQIVPYNVYKPLALTFVLPSWPTPIPSSPLWCV